MRGDLLALALIALGGFVIYLGMSNHTHAFTTALRNG